MGRVDGIVKDDILVPDDEVNFFCCDLKSFYASVECAERNLDSFSNILVVADPDSSKGTLCLAITPAMKILGVKNRCRIYETTGITVTLGAEV